MAEKPLPSNIIPPKLAEEFENWQLPDVGQSLPQGNANLFGHRGLETSASKMAEKPILPPTIAEIEAIRAAAEQEGFAEGQSAGMAAGLEQGKLQGLEQGHTEGYAQGLEQGMAEGLSQAAALLNRFEQLLSQFDTPLALLDNQIEQSLLQLVEQLSRAVICHELKTHPEHLLAVLRQGIDSLPIKEQKVTLRLHPDDVALVRQLYGDEQLNKNQWLLEPEPSLTAGECVIRCQRSQVDLRLGGRMEQVFSELLQRQTQLDSSAVQLEAKLTAATATATSHPPDTADEVADGHGNTPTTTA